MSNTALGLFTRLGAVKPAEFSGELVKSLQTVLSSSWRQQRFEGWFREYYKKAAFQPRKVGQDFVLLYAALLYPFLFWGHMSPHTAEKKEELLKNKYAYKIAFGN